MAIPNTDRVRFSRNMLTQGSTAKRAVGVSTIIQLNNTLNPESEHDWGEPDVANICRPNNKVSCAACCGIYNVIDASAELMTHEMRRRSSLFARVTRHVDDMVNFKAFISETSRLRQLDPDIHVCEFIGFLDPHELIVGCMLHPCSTGNGGTDFRGLCHYGAMACKAFYCPAWKQLNQGMRKTVAMIVPDWRAYGLIITDLAYLSGMTRLVEGATGRSPGPLMMTDPKIKQQLSNLLMLKVNWPFASDTGIRQSNYYLTGPLEKAQDQDPLEMVLKSLSFTYDRDFTGKESSQLIMAEIDSLARLLSHFG
ncbi:MAG: hypothetical protein PHS86_12800 [Syntrophaceae bacterium]|nr:hypothetical protein [Syntrophaceae bacterium]